MDLMKNAQRAKRFLGRLPAILGAPKGLRTPEALRAFFPDVPPETLTSLRLDLVKNDAFYHELDHAMLAVRNRRVVWLEYLPFLYTVVRVTKPKQIVETGVFDGVSSSVILQALADNAKSGGVDGKLESIDLPAVESIAWATDAMPETSLPTGRQPGWLIPERLRSHHTLNFGDAKELLPKVLTKHGTIDMFYHDSLHTDEHMSFEFNAAWPHVRKNGGIVGSDDVLFNSAWMRFAKAHQKPYVLVDGTGMMHV